MFSPDPFSTAPQCLQYPYFFDMVTKMIDVVINSAQTTPTHYGSGPGRRGVITRPQGRLSKQMRERNLRGVGGGGYIITKQPCNLTGEPAQQHE